MSKVNEKTTITLGLVWVLLTAILSATCIVAVGVFRGATWMKSVDDRLFSIEQQLGISHFAESYRQKALSQE